MPSVNDIQLVFDESHVFTGGQTLEGSVHVDVESDCDCKELLLSLSWYTSGRGPRNTETVDDQTLYSGNWQRQKEYDYDFSIDLPPGPYSYDGDLITVGWVLEVKADVRNEAYHRARTQIRVEPGAAKDYSPGLPLSKIREYSPGAHYNRREFDETFAANEGQIALPIFLFGLLFLFGILIRSFLKWTQGDYDDDMGLTLTCFTLGLLLTGSGGAALYTMSREHMSDDRVRTIEMTIEPDEINPGDSAKAELKMYAKRSLEITQINCMCRGYERFVDPKSSLDDELDDGIHRKIKHEEKISPDDLDTRSLQEGQVGRYEFHFDIPDSAPFSFYSTDNQVIWELETYIFLENAPDVTQRQPFIVRPETKL